MPSIARSPASEKQPTQAPFVLSDAELLERLRAVRGLEASLVAELRARNVEPPTAQNACGHPDSAPAVIGPTGSECSPCALKRMRADHAARETRTEFAAHFRLLPDGG